MQKDFKIGLAIGVVLAAVAVIWLATLPNLSTKSRALEAASETNPSPKTPSYVPPSQPTPDSEIQITPAPSAIEGSIETPAANNEQRTMNTEPTQRIHIVQKGDTLSSIAAKYYGSANQWRKIVNANRTNLPDPNRLAPGVKLIIPE
jgi:5'-nucleotidase / UDP-sugar diphosphatase